MGQYHVPVNLDRREFIHPHAMGDGLKLGEWMYGSTAAALALLLAGQNHGGPRGGGDLATTDAIVGLWAGQRVYVLGDYYNASDFPAELAWLADDNPWLTATDTSWTEISKPLRAVLRADGHQLHEAFGHYAR